MEQSLLQHADGFFATELCWRMKKRGMSIRDVTGNVGCSFEQIRKVTRGATVHSDVLATRLCQVVGIDAKLARQKILIDRLRQRFGAALWPAFDKPPEMEPFYMVLPYLTKEQRDDFHEQIEAFVKAKEIIAKKKKAIATFFATIALGYRRKLLILLQ